MATPPNAPAPTREGRAKDLSAGEKNMDVSVRRRSFLMMSASKPAPSPLWEAWPSEGVWQSADHDGSEALMLLMRGGFCPTGECVAELGQDEVGVSLEQVGGEGDAPRKGSAMACCKREIVLCLVGRTR